VFDRNLDVLSPTLRGQRVEPPVMTIAVELRPDHVAAVYRDVAQAVDAILARAPAEPDEVVPLATPQERLAPPPPTKVRTHAIIPEGDPWALVEEPV